ncbi:hypothetical protein PI125_g8377 [Phytophthora idaei]|nr:hypothetical protein PI125_g8377 [Phytophthora idaei]
MHCLSDAGYCLTSRVFTPYPIRLGMDAREGKYDSLHSRTRITVEQAFGRLKGVSRIYKQPLQQETPEYMALIIVATLVLHNWLID